MRIAGAMAGCDPEVVAKLADDLLLSSKPRDEARRVSNPAARPIGAEELIGGCLTRHGLAADAQTISRLRRAMAIPIHDGFRPLPGAPELLEAIRGFGMRSVIASNTYWRDAESYWEDFRKLGMADHIDGIITSVDAGHLKPHPAVFELAMRWAGVNAHRCVVIGNREDNDIGPARALGMRTILVYPDDPKPDASAADAVVPDLWECVTALRDMLENG